MYFVIRLFFMAALLIQGIAGCSSGKPNFLIIMTDDQGHDDIGFYNTNNILQTPNMDSFAAESVRFENFYTDSLCAPTRASLLTGRHHLKTGVWGVHGAMDYINLDETLIPQALQQAGYKTSLFGKWHSGITPGYNPEDRGFQETYVAKLYTFFNNVVKKNGQDMQTRGWVEDWLADRIIDYLEQRNQDGNPFALFWTPMSIHRGRVYDFESAEDFVAPQEYYERYPSVSRDLKHVFAMITYFDTVFGRVIQKLDQTGLSDNTVVMFFGDNGPHVYQTDHEFNPNRQLRIPSQMKDEKGFIEENGVRNFLFVRGTNRFPAGRQVFDNVGVIDIYPTVLDLAGVSAPARNKPLDGLSFAPLLCKKGSWSHYGRTLYFHEVLKNQLQTDDIPELDANRNVNPNQQLLSFYGGGRNGNGLELYTGLRWQQWKYLKSNLFDIESTNHQEYFNQRTFDSELQGNLKKRLNDWWWDVLKQSGSFAKPTFLIGKVFRSPVRMIGASQRTQGNVIVNDHAVQGFKNPGDLLICTVYVEQGGNYDVVLNYGWTQYKGAQVKVAVGQYWQLMDGSAPALFAKIDSNGPKNIGQVYLPKTKDGEKHEMLFQLESSEQQGSDVFWWFDSIEFVKKPAEN